MGGFGDVFGGLFGYMETDNNLPDRGVQDAYGRTKQTQGINAPYATDPRADYFDFNWDPDGVYGAGDSNISRGDKVLSYAGTDDNGNPIQIPATGGGGGGGGAAPNASKQAQVDALRRYENRVINPQVQQQLLDAAMGKAPGQNLLHDAATGNTESQQLLRGAALGNAPSQAELMLQRQGQSIANQAMSQARSAREYNPALERSAMDSGVTARADAAQRAAEMRAGEMATARGMFDSSMSSGRSAYDSSLGAGRGMASSYALGQQGANDQMTSLLRQQDFQRAAAQQAGGIAYNNAQQNSVNSANALRLGVAEGYRKDQQLNDMYALARNDKLSGYFSQMGQGTGDIYGSVLSAIGGMSDERAKKDITPIAPGDVNEMLSKLVPVSYEYKNPNTPVTRPGPQAGILAQDLEKSPIGATMVRDTPQGKIIDTNAAIGTLLATNAELNRRLNKIEGKDVEIGKARIDSEQLRPTGEKHPATGRAIYKNSEGEPMTEYGTTVTDSRLNQGKPTNIPSVWGDRVYYNTDEAIQHALESGSRFPSYGSVNEAVEASKQHSSELGTYLDKNGRLIRPEVRIGKAQIDPIQFEIGEAQMAPEFVTPDHGTIVRNIGPAFKMGVQDPNNKARSLELLGAGKARRAKYGV